MTRKPFQFGLKALFALMLVFSVAAAIRFSVYRKVDGYQTLDNIIRKQDSQFVVIQAPECPGPYLNFGTHQFGKGQACKDIIRQESKPQRTISIPAEPNVEFRVLELQARSGEQTYAVLRRVHR